jgi:Cu(I)/Ag(I) efflux system membrane fusion protein
MKRRYKILILLLIAGCFFLAGYWVNHNSGGRKPAEARRILHYVDPMNPAFKSDKAGIAPCGMPLVPVYADKNGFAADGSDPRDLMPPGAVRISVEKQQLIGVKVMTVEKAPWNHTLRVLGRVTPDETLVYRITAASSSWIQEVLPVTTGGLVRKDELLATFSFFSTEFRTALQAYLNTVSAGAANLPGNTAPEATASQSVQRAKEQRIREYENIRLTGRGTPGSQVDYYRQNLFNYGITPFQLEEIERTRMIPEAIDIRSPAAGFILSRNVSPGLRFDRGTELFRIADLSRVWILADVFENEASFFKPGMRVKMELPYQKKTLYARMSPVLPQFDPATRTLKVRLEADNPDYAMRPDMFVNVELPVSGPPAILVPVDAVVDSGLKKTVFVDRGNGFFEPRQVETGRSLGERVEIARGLMPGEKIVVSGNFLLDSETRMQQASATTTGKISRDPVCGMNVDEDSARAEGNVRQYKGSTYFFCAPGCLDEFVKTPERYLKSSPAAGKMPMNATDVKKAHD